MNGETLVHVLLISCEKNLLAGMHRVQAKGILAFQGTCGWLQAGYSVNRTAETRMGIKEAALE